MYPHYDLIIIGAGPGGYTAAIAAAQHGMKTALVEARETGGTCLNRGCIPTKTLLHSAELFREMKDAESLGILAEGLSYDLSAMYRRRDEVTEELRSGIEALIKANKVDLYFAQAKVLTANRVLLNSSEESFELETDKILLAVGSFPSLPPIEGIKLRGVVTSDELLEGPPIDFKSLVIIGGGVIGVEFASIFGSLGCTVTILEAAERIVPTLDREISQNLSMILKRRGVSIQCSCLVECISEDGGELCCHFTGKGGSSEIRAQSVLVSVGRKPNTAGLFADNLDIAQQRGIVVNEHFETSEKGIYAIGDAVEGSIQLAHAASAEAHNVIAEMLGEKPPVNLSVVPSCIFTSPEIASVGLTAEQAKASGIEVKIGKYAMSGNGKTVIERQERSFIKLTFDADTNVILGAQLMCSRASDLISEMTSAIANKLTVQQLLAVIRPHPTFTEAVTEALEDTEDRAVHIMPKAKR
ncbi:MAG: dihydrolipoyl dehydrogenase [Clostridia bacterium]|nr:dihydrolipoyl dehydrogenase [Clostridia bacterium]